MSEGYVKIFRKLKKTLFYKNSKVLHLAIELLLVANHKKGQILVKNKVVTLDRGQAWVGRKALSNDTGLSERSVRTSLEILKTIGFLTTKPTNSGSLVTIVNYDYYQSMEHEVASRSTSKRPASDQQPTTNKNVKNDKNLKKEKINKKKKNPPDSDFEKYLETWNRFTDSIHRSRGVKLSKVKLLTAARIKKLKKHISAGLTLEIFCKGLNTAFNEEFYYESNWFDFDWILRFKNSKGDDVCNWSTLYERQLENKEN